MEENEDIKAAKQELDRINQDEILWKEALDIEITRMDNAQYLEDAENRGIRKGKKEAKLEAAKKMLEKGLNLQIIEEVTGLTSEEIKKLKD